LELKKILPEKQKPFIAKLDEIALIFDLAIELINGIHKNKSLVRYPYVNEINACKKTA
jgi:hypothetical protein